MQNTQGTTREEMTAYVCVREGTPLTANAASLESPEGVQYPIVEGIPILTHRPQALLMEAYRSLLGTIQALDAQVQAARALEHHNHTAGLQRRIERWHSGTEADLALLGQHLPALSTANSSSHFDIVDWLSAQNGGWSPQRMLPYFYQDWGGTEEFTVVHELLESAWLRHRADDGNLAVLGAGACGIANAYAQTTRQVYAVDLSLVTLLLAQRLLAGEQLTIHPAAAHWRATQLSGPSTRASNLSLLVANANAMPFASMGMSGVITQYFMDLPGNPIWTAREIRRVLDPGGIWINFSNPFQLPGENRDLGFPDLEEVGELLSALGFEVLEAEEKTFTLNNMRKIRPNASIIEQEVHFFVARKTSRTEQSEMRDHARRFSRDPSFVEAVVAPIPGRAIQFETRRTCSPASPGDQLSALVVGGQSYGLSEESAKLAQAFFGLIDGQRTTQVIRNCLADRGILWSDAQLHEIFHFIEDHYGLVKLCAPERD